MLKFIALSIVALVASYIAVEGEEWWREGLIYQVYPRSFKDSNNDGIGDLPGITSKLAYLKELGVTGVWLSPIYPSPMVDFGYDISNFVDVNPEYGTLSDFDDMVKTAKSLGLHLIMDFVPNHSSDKHEWFIKSVKREPGYEDYYVWRDAKGTNADGTPVPPNNWVSLFYGSAWEWNSDREQFYLHQFAVAQPDLNYSNPAVVQEMKDVITFWLDRGVDGFRIDAIPFLFEDPELRDEPIDPSGQADPYDYSHTQHIYTRDYQATYDMVTQWRQLIDAKSAADGHSRCIMVEAYASLDMTMKYFGTEEKPSAHFPFNFQLIPITNVTSARDLRRLIHEWQDNLPPVLGHSNWLVGNHDNHRIGSRVGSELIDAMNILVLSLPGTAVTYYGEEIGMVDNLNISYADGKDPQGCNNDPTLWYQLSRDFERTPYQWDATVNAGFNEGAQPWLPVHENYMSLNLEAQRNASRSHYSVYKAMTTLRQTDVFKQGQLTVHVQDNVLIILRNLNSAFYGVVLINIGEEEETVDLDSILLLGHETQLTVYTSSVHSSTLPGTTVSAGAVTVSPYAALVLMPPPNKQPKISFVS